VDAGLTRYLQKISVGPHLLQADEPNETGGTDAGPSPHELLLAALGSCIGITLRMFADRRRWSLQTVQVKLSHRKIPVEESGAKLGMVERIELNVSLTGNLTEDQRSKLMEISEKCPVHRTLVSQVQIRTTLTEPS